ncbi:MAG: 16 kDa heat shock protein A [Osedax symbiont Rs1]|nr:MAG: 16 kDa heat shock protein A [Osedax symbiont Rs1]
MRTLDLTPLYRSAIGFDRIASMIDSAARNDQPSFPPYNVELLSENEYRITMAVAGFSLDELLINSEQGSITISGEKASNDDNPHYLYQGIAARNFERRFQLADHMKVVNASMENGLLHVNLVREIPEAMKPRSIKIEQ